MPTYEYACRDCGEHLEVVQSFKDDPLTQCPSCDGTLRKVFSAAGIVFKGSGWHIKDYAASKPAADSDKTGDSSSEPASESGSTSTPSTGEKSGGSEKKTPSSGEKKAPSSGEKKSA